MYRLGFLLIACGIRFAGIAAGPPAIADVSGSVPNSNTAHQLQETWLSFHEIDLCQEVDSLFVFDKNGMEVWSRIESERSFQKFRSLFEPLKNSYPIELYTTRPPAEKKRDYEDDPPPSLWQNYELRANLGDRAAFAIRHLIVDDHPELDLPSSDLMLKQRLLIYAEQTLGWNKKIERYASDMTALTRLANDPSVASDLKSRANSVCAVHAQNLEKYIGKLAANLARALPTPEKQKRGSSPRPETSALSGKSPLERADQISAMTQGVSRRIYRFIHPEHYTVELEELRHPSLLDSLETLRRTVSEFRQSLARSARK